MKINSHINIFILFYFFLLHSRLETIISVNISNFDNSIKSNNLYIKNELQDNQIEITNNIHNNENLKTNNNNYKRFFNWNNEKKFDISMCELVTNGPICLMNGDRIFLPMANPKGLSGYWSFDEASPFDDSGNGNHAINLAKVGPSLGGIGNSALFSEGNFLKVPNQNIFNTINFTITFWFYLINQKIDENLSLKLCPILQKGDDDLFNKSYSRLPAIFFDRKDKNFKIYTKTNLQNLNQGESFNSNAKVTSDKWYHIALIKKNEKLFFYVNGILDFKFDLKGTQIINSGNLYIGGSPAYSDQCKFSFLIDELRYYNVAIEEDYIEAEASPSLGGIEPNFLQLGCLNCNIKQAASSCVDGYKLCSSIEMHTAGYQISRTMGWLKFDTHIWTHGALENEKEFENVKGLALCCAEIK